MERWFLHVFFDPNTGPILGAAQRLELLPYPMLTLTCLGLGLGLEG